jgi:hypothetical protein
MQSICNIYQQLSIEKMNKWKIEATQMLRCIEYHVQGEILTNCYDNNTIIKCFICLLKWFWQILYMRICMYLISENCVISTMLSTLCSNYLYSFQFSKKSLNTTNMHGN